MATHSNDPEPPPDAIVMPHMDHQRVRDLFKAYEAATDPQAKRELAEEACRLIEMHAQLEKNIFSPAVNEQTDSKRQRMHKQEALANILARAKYDVLRLFQGYPAEPPRWKPTSRAHYFLILGDGEINRFQWYGTSFDEEAWNFGNCFRSRKDAEQARDAVKELFVNFYNRHAKREKLWEYNVRDATRFAEFMMCYPHRKETLQTMLTLPQRMRPMPYLRQTPQA
jgi:hypothetical protein